MRVGMIRCALMMRTFGCVCDGLNPRYRSVDLPDDGRFLDAVFADPFFVYTDAGWEGYRVDETETKLGKAR